MIIGINGSMDAEMSFTASLNKIEEKRVGAFVYTRYEYLGHTLIASACGTGKASAAANTAGMLLTYKPDLMLNMGTAGAVSFAVKNKDVVIGTRVVQHDYDISEFGYEKNELCELKKVYLEADKRFAECAEKVSGNIRIHYGCVCSGDHLITTREQRNDLSARFDGLAAEMEGGAVAEVSELFGVPFALLKGISDGEEDTDSKSQFHENIGSVADIIGELLLKILEIY